MKQKRKIEKCGNRFAVFALLFVIVISLSLFSGCGEIPGDAPDFIPVIAFGNSVPRVVVDTSIPEDYALAVYSFNGPLITSFEKNSAYVEGEEYYISLFDSQMVISIISQSNGDFHFQGIMADGSGYLNVYYSQPGKTFSFDQVIYVDAMTDFELIIYAEGDDISLDSNGYFHDYYRASYVINIPEIADPYQPESFDLVSGTYEIYRGIMNSSGAVGTGLAYYSDADTDPSVGTRFYTTMNTFDPTSVAEAPNTVSLAELAGWKTYLSSSSVFALDTDISTWQIFYKLDSQTSPKGVTWHDINDTYNISSLLSGFSTTNTNGDDLSTWGSVSLLVASMP